MNDIYVQNVSYQNPVYKKTNINNENFFSKKQRIIILSLLAIIALLLLIIAILVTKTENKSVNSRTIMIYMCGSNLESDGGIATADLESINPNLIDLSTTNILIYTGGTRQWKNNYASTYSNNILLLTNEGYKVIKQDTKKNLGDSNTFSEFLNYAYENYKADVYDLIIYDHGMGALGSISDDFTNDYLLASEMKTALEHSYFNSNNKIETVLFRTCLNGTAEIASVYAPYANYMVASEEVTLGNPTSDVFSFINDLQLSDSGYDFGTKFINGYKNFIDGINFYGDIDSTYSIIDLSYEQELEKSLDDLFKDVNVNKNFNALSKIRANMHQYAVESADDSEFDTVDLYELVYSLKDISPEKSEKTLKIISKMVKQNWSVNNHSHGLSVYFPYYGNSKVVNMHMGIYDLIGFSKNYYAFIKQFDGIKKETSNFNMNFSDNTSSVKNKEYKISLTDDQVKNFARARSIIYQKNSDGTYGLVARSNVSLKGNELSTKLYDNIITISNGKEKTFIPVSEITPMGKYKEYLTYVVLTRRKDGKLDTINGNMHLRVKNNKVYESEIIKSDKGKESGIIINPKDYDTLTFEHTRWNVLDSNGNYIGPQKTESMYIFDYPIKDGYDFSLSSLADGDYYCIFQIYDVKGNTYYSKLEKIK